MRTAEAYRLIHTADRDLDPLLEAAGSLRDRFKGRTVTYSRKIFLPVTNLCRDRCGYCTFRKDPADPGAWTMSPVEIDDLLARGNACACKEALMCLGDKPEAAFPQYRATLARFGHRTTAEYVARECQPRSDARKRQSAALAEGYAPLLCSRQTSGCPVADDRGSGRSGHCVH